MFKSVVLVKLELLDEAHLTCCYLKLSHFLLFQIRREHLYFQISSWIVAHRQLLQRHIPCFWENFPWSEMLNVRKQLFFVASRAMTIGLVERWVWFTTDTDEHILPLYVRVIRPSIQRVRVMVWAAKWHGRHFALIIENNLAGLRHPDEFFSSWSIYCKFVIQAITSSPNGRPGSHSKWHPTDTDSRGKFSTATFVTSILRPPASHHVLW